MKSRSLRCMALVLAGCCQVAAQENIYESATYAAGGGGYYGLNDQYWMGCRFHLDSLTPVGSIGGNFNRLRANQGTFFGGLFRLDSPSGDPWAGGASPSGSSPSFIASTVCEITQAEASGDHYFHLSTSLPAGDYALMFGGGAFGAPNVGVVNDAISVIADGTLFPGASILVWDQQNQSWLSANNYRPRFFVSSAPIPEPSILALAIVGCASIIVLGPVLQKMRTS